MNKLALGVELTTRPPDGRPRSPNLKNKAPKSSGAKHGGRRPGAGRKKGTPNKLTADVKSAIMQAFNEVGAAEYLRKLARSDPSTCYDEA